MLDKCADEMFSQDHECTECEKLHMQLQDVLQLKQGSVVPLNKLAGDPADIYVNGRLVARGEVLVLNDNFCIRVAELIVGENACD